jgi:hypothetical protein
MGGCGSICYHDFSSYCHCYYCNDHLDVISFDKLLPDGWYSVGFGTHLDLSWTGKFAEFNTKIKSDGYELFSLFFGMALMKGIISSIAGPAPNYDMQKILSTKSPREASLMSGFVSVVLMPVRYLMIAGIAVIGLIVFDQIKTR